ncbi:uncharacterized protein LOC105157942 isoform X1 [Sesamum indicum]|uniref:Uncharacterized protein LOC105157942 isoform X1 n=1 Tax=Sesamum indicum TaxID=4182 RepID=A0A6I9SYH9_SESIN|nr:uncharacterized protein LOC105157942 isoform X1 [Sesamum indicum]
MGQGDETKTRPAGPSIEIQERGDIFFFYRPKVDKEEARGAKDVQRFYLLLRPYSAQTDVQEKQDPNSGKEGAKRRRLAHHDETNYTHEHEHEQGGGHGSHPVNFKKQPLLRFIVMGRKSLPDPSKKTRPYWGFVEMVTTEIEHVKAALRGEEYETATKGHRHLPDSRAVGEGIYRILKHNPGSSSMHTHLVYKLEFPPEGEEEEPQKALNIARQASFLLQIKNPDQRAAQFRGLEKKRKAAFPAHLQGLFGHRLYHPADPPDLLNYEGCEFLLISASDDIEQELGLELKTTEQLQDAECSDLIRTFGETAASTRPLFQGTWV